MENLKSILNKFAAKKTHPRGYLCNPFTSGGYTYATDGSIVVRCKTGLPDDINDDQIRIKNKLDEHLKVETNNYNLVADIAIESRGPCGSCKGSGVVEDWECSDCGGEGEFDHGRHTYECKGCDGSGKNVTCHVTGCSSCWGRGILFEDRVFFAGVSAYAPYYIILIHSLEDAKFFTHKVNNKTVAYFTFKGGEGVLIPLNIDDVDRSQQ